MVKRVVFRVDASLRIGAGHVMRCLALADALAARGSECHFICRDLPGNLIQFICDKGYGTHVIPAAAPKGGCLTEFDRSIDTSAFMHEQLYGDSVVDDAKFCSPILAQLKPDWLIVDHYDLDAHWERSVRCLSRNLMVIDDLANRDHDCDILVDQTLECVERKYVTRVPAGCLMLVGSQYALLRREFSEWRDRSIVRRNGWQVRHVLVSFGGMDLPNATHGVCESLLECGESSKYKFTVVIGAKSPWKDSIISVLKGFPDAVLKVGVQEMAALTAASDLAIGAAGITSWERCCLGVPSIVAITAPNQLEIANALWSAGAAFQLPDNRSAWSEHLGALFNGITPDVIATVSQRAAAVCDGLGSERVAKVIYG